MPTIVSTMATASPSAIPSATITTDPTVISVMPTSVSLTSDKPVFASDTTSAPSGSPTQIVVDGAGTPTSNGTTVCNGLTTDQRRESLYELIRGISDERNMFDDTETPQYAAFQWLLNEDPAQVCPEDVISAEQRYILSLLYFSTNGDDWLTCNRPEAPELKPCSYSRYLSADDECLWMGTASANCNADGTLRILSVDENNLKGTLPSEITSLRALEHIDLASNLGIRGPIPDGLDNLNKLISFDVDWNQLSGAIPESLYDTVSLVALDLNNNKLISSISTSIGKMTNLGILQVDKNRLTGSIPSEIGNASSLSMYYCLLQASYLLNNASSHVFLIMLQQSLLQRTKTCSRERFLKRCTTLTDFVSVTIHHHFCASKCTFLLTMIPSSLITTRCSQFARKQVERATLHQHWQTYQSRATVLV